MRPRRIEIRRAFLQRQPLQRRSPAEEGALHDVVALDRQRHRPADAGIGERPRPAVEGQVHVRPERGVEPQVLVLLDLAHGGPGDVVDQIDVAGLQGRHPQVLVRICHDPDGLELRHARLVETLEGFEVDRDAALQLLQLEGTGPDREAVAAERARRHHRHEIGRQPVRNGDGRLLHDKPDRALVRRLDPLHPLELAAHIGGGLRVRDLFQVPLDVLGADGRAVLELRLPQVEHPAGIAVAFPAFGQFTLNLAIRRERQQAPVDECRHGPGGGAGIDPGLEVRRIGRQADRQVAAFAGRAGGSLAHDPAGQSGERQARSRNQEPATGYPHDGTSSL